MEKTIERISQLLEKNNMTAKNLCLQLGIRNTNTVSEWRKGKTKPSAETLVNIARIFQVSLDWLLTGQEKDTNIENTNKYLDLDIEGLSEESKEELGKFIRLLKIKDSVEKTKDEESYLLQKKA